MSATLTTLVRFNLPPPSLQPILAGSLFANSDGDLFGTANNGGSFGADTVFEMAKDGSRLRQRADYAGQLQLPRKPGGRLDRRFQRRPVRDDRIWRRFRRRHGVRGRQDRQWLREHADHAG